MSEGTDDNWEMPKPVFRSSTGSLPKTFEETISQSFSPDTATVEIGDNDDILGLMKKTPPESGEVIKGHIEQVDPVSQPAPDNNVRAKTVSSQPKRAGMSLAVIFLLIALLAAAVAAAYYLLNR